MKCIILAGGRGTRLTPLTDDKPKPLIKIGEQPILYHIIERFKKQGITDFIIAVGYKGFMIEKYVKKNPIKDVNIEVVRTGESCKTGDRLKKVYPNEPFIVTYGDDISNVDIREVIKQHEEDTRPSITMTVAKVKSNWGHIKLGKFVDTEVEEFNEKPMLDDWVNAGNWVVDSVLCDKIKKGQTLEEWCMGLIEDYEVNAYKYNGFFYGMNTYADYLFLNDLWNKNQNWEEVC